MGFVKTIVLTDHYLFFYDIVFTIFVLPFVDRVDDYQIDYFHKIYLGNSHDFVLCMLY